MSRTRIQEIVTLTKEGWRPYDAEPEQRVYERLGCNYALRGQKRKPFWFVRDDVYCCIGCADHCTLKSGGLPRAAAHQVFRGSSGPAVYLDARGNAGAV